ncbi:coiled-coil domain-containing protein [Mycoplasma sp. HF14]
MNKKIAKVIMPIASASILAVPSVLLISASNDDENSMQDLGGDNSGFSGNYVSNKEINIFKTGDKTADNAIFGNIYPSIDSANLEWNKLESNQNVWMPFQSNTDQQAIQNKGWFSSSSIDKYDKLVNKYFDNVVKIEDITNEGKPKDYFAISTSPRRRWRATFNNYYIPKSPMDNVKPNANNYFYPDVFGNLTFGIFLSNDLQIVDNSMRISVIARNYKYEETNVPNTMYLGLVKNILNSENDKPLITGDITVADASDDGLGTLNWNPSEFETKPIYIGENGFYQNWSNGADIPEGWFNSNKNRPFLVNNLRYVTIDSKSNADETIQEIINGTIHQDGDPTQPLKQTLNNAFLRPVSNSPYSKNKTDVGSVFMGQVSMGNQWTNANGVYQPTVVLEFETIDNQETLPNNQYSYINGKSNNNGGITAVTTYYRGLYWNCKTAPDCSGTFVATNSVNYNRNKYRAINVKIKEKAINNYQGFKNKLYNYFIPNDAYGYELYYKESDGNTTKIAEIPADVVAKAKSQTYKDRTKDFTINLTFNSDPDLWPEEMKKDYKSLTSANRLILKKVFNSKTAPFFSQDPEQKAMNEYIPDKTGELNLADIYNNSSSLMKTGELEFISEVQWMGSGSNRTGYNKLRVLNNSETATSRNGGSSSLYKNFSYKNFTLSSAQQAAIQDAMYKDWTIANFNNEKWQSQLSDLKQSSYDANKMVTTTQTYESIYGYANTPTSEANKDAKEFLNINNYNSQDPATKAKMNYFINYLFADDVNRATYRNDLETLKQWPSKSVPNYTANDSGVVDNNEAAKNIKEMVDNYNASIQALNATGYQGFEAGQNLTSAEFVKKAFEIIDSTTLFSGAYKDAFKTQVLQKTSRAEVVSLVNSMLELQSAYQSAVEMYNKYVPVDSNAKYKAVQITSGSDNTFNTFKNAVAQYKLTIDLIQNYSQSNINSALLDVPTNLNKLKTLANTYNLETKYQELTTDITAAKEVIANLGNLTPKDIEKLNNKLDNIITKTTPVNYKELENYSQREIKINVIIAEAKYKSHLNQIATNNPIFAKEFIAYSSSKYSNSIQNVVSNETTEIQQPLGSVLVQELNDYHTNIPSVEEDNGLDIFIFPNTNLDSASVNFPWQVDAKTYFISKTPYPKAKYDILKATSSTYTIPEQMQEAFDKVLSNASTSFNSVDEITTFLNQWNGRIDKLLANITALETKVNTLEAPNSNNLNQAQYQYFVSQYLNAYELADQGSITNSVQAVDANVTNTISAMTELNSVLSKYVTDPSSQDNVFMNGQYYSLGNLDKYAREKRGVFNFDDTPKANGQFIALISTAFQLLQQVPNGINQIVSESAPENELLAAQTAQNLASVLKLSTFSKATPYTWYAYTSEQINQLIDSIKQAVKNMDGRYQAVLDYPNYILDKYFNSINAEGSSLFTVEEGQAIIQQLKEEGKLPQDAADFDFNKNSDIYQEINVKLLLPAITKYISGLEHLSQNEKSAAMAQANAIFGKPSGTSQDKTVFSSLNAGNTEEPKTLWKIQAILYQASQINEVNKGIANKLSEYQNLTQPQKDTLNAKIGDVNLWNDASLNISNLQNALPAKFSELGEKILYNPQSNPVSATAKELDDAMLALKTLYNKVNEELNVGKENQSDRLTYATNKVEFMKAYNAIGEIDKISNIVPSQITQLTTNLQTQYDLLNGYLQMLKDKIAAIDPSIKEYVGQDTYNTATDISSLNKLNTKEDYDRAYQEVKNKLAQAISNKIPANEANLNNAQVSGLQEETKALGTNPEKTFADLKDQIDKIKALDIGMNDLSASLSNVNKVLEDNKAIWDKISNPELKDKVQQAISSATSVLNKVSGSNDSAQQVATIKKSLDDLLPEINKALTIQQIKDLVNENINDNSAKCTQDFKNDIQHYLDNPSTLTNQEANKLLQSTKNAIAVDPLRKEIEQASEITPMSKALQDAIATVKNTAKDMFNSPTTPAPKDVQDAIDALKNAVKLNELENEITKAQGVIAPSKALQDAINNASVVANNKETTKYDDQIKKLQEAMLKEPLNKEIEAAQAVQNETPNPELQSAIAKAQEIAAKNDLTPEQVQQAVKELNDVISNVAKDQHAKNRLKDLIAKAKEQANVDTDKDYINKVIQEAENALNKQGNKATDYDLAKGKLTYALDLNKLIQAVNTSKQLVETDKRAEKLSNTLSAADAFIADEKTKIESLTEFNQEDFNTFDAAVNSQLSSVFTDTNTNAIYFEKAKLQANNPESQDPKDKPYSDNFINNGNTIVNSSNALVPNNSFELSSSQENNVAEAIEKLQANAAYYQMNKLLNSLPADLRISKELEKALKDAKLLSKELGNDINLNDENKVQSLINIFVPELQEQELKDLSNTPYKLIIEANKKLQLANLQNPLANAIVDAEDLQRQIAVTPQDEANAEISTQVQALKEQMQPVADAIKAAQEVITRAPENSQAYQEAVNALKQATKVANDLVNGYRKNLQDAIQQALNIQNPNAGLSDALAKATEVMNATPVSTAVDVIKALNNLQKAGAKDQLEKLINSVPQELKDSKTFKDIALSPATATLNNPDATLDDINKAIEKLQNNLKKQELYNAYDKAIANKQEILPEAQKLIDEAKKILEDTNNQYLDKDKNFFDQKAKELSDAIGVNNLTNAISQAEAIPESERSQQLQDALKQAAEVAKNATTNTPEVNNAATEKLIQAINKNVLVNAIVDAGDIIKKLTPKEGQTPVDNIQQLLDNIKQALATAQSELDNPQATKESLNTAANVLQNAIVPCKDAYNKALNGLQDLIDEVKAIPKNISISKMLKGELENAENIMNDQNKNIYDLNNETDKLEFALNANRLANAVENAPTLEANIPSYSNEILEKSEAMLKDQNTPAKDLIAQSTAQKVNNYEINALNDIATLSHLNNAQRNALYNEVMQATKGNITSLTHAKKAISAINKKAIKLNDSMYKLKQLLEKIPEEYKQNPITVIKYTFASPERQEAFAKALKDALDVVNVQNGQVISDNDPKAISTMKVALQEAFDRLNGNKVFEEKTGELEGQVNDLNSNINANSLFNSPKALQEKLKELQKQAANAIPTIKDKTQQSNETYANAVNIVKQLQDTISAINQFSEQQYMLNDKVVPQIEYTASQMNNLDPTYVNSQVEAFNKDTTYNNASDIMKSLNNLNAQYQGVLDKVASDIKTNTDNVPDINKDLVLQDKNDLASLMHANKEKVNELNNLNNNLSALNNLSSILNNYLDTGINQGNYETNLDVLQQALDSAREIESQNYPTVANEQNNYLNKLITIGTNVIKVVSALESNDSNAFSEAIDALSKIDPKYNEFAKELEANDYFNIVNIDKINKQQASQLINIVNSDAFSQMPEVIRSAIVAHVRKAANNATWWIWIVISTSLVWLAGMILLVSNKGPKY